jgi:DNA-binding NarL/FixJ family response regulator
VTSAPEQEGVHPDSQLVAAVVREEQRLVVAYRTVMARHRQLRPALSVLLDHHETHLEVLGAAANGSGAPSRGRSERAALALLRRLEADTIASLRRSAVGARSGDLARALASMAASGAQHVVVLDGLAGASRRGPS